MILDDDFQFGNGGSCCGKPVGCNMTHEGCVWLRHPWKQEHVFGQEVSEERQRAWRERDYLKWIALIETPGHDFHAAWRPKEEGEGVGRCTLCGLYGIGEISDCMSREGHDHRQVREFAEALGELADV